MPTWAETALQALGGILGVGVIGWLAKRQIARIDAQEERIQAMAAAMKGKAERDELKADVARIFDKLDEHARESRKSMEKLGAKLDKAIAEQSKINLEVVKSLANRREG